MTVRNRIYPIFLPHAGCPFQCVYCNQKLVTASGPTASPAAEPVSYVRRRLDELAEHAQRTSLPGEIAFYGGTFTALGPASLLKILDAASAWVQEGAFTGIRFSTRPDGVGPETCRLLDPYPVRTVELGAQSLSNEVLTQSRRGYSAGTVQEAAARVKRHGWGLGLQLMAGLPGDTKERFLQTVRETVDLKPDLVRIYPTLVLEGTVLAHWYRTGSYRPLSVEEAVQWCAPAHDLFVKARIPIARMGLHSDPELQKPGHVLAGPHHPAFGYLVRVHGWRNRVDEYLQAHAEEAVGKEMTIRVDGRLVSEVIGPSRSSLLHWKEAWGLKGVIVGKSAEGGREIEITLAHCHPVRTERS